MVLLIGFLLLATVFAYALARALTGLYTRVAEQAQTDPLTGLWNRRRMAEILREVERAVRFGHPLSLLILDVDDFKEINDTEGHLQGDAVLRKIAEVVREHTRSIDVAARYGGDEIALILPETDVEGAARLAERLRTGVMEAKIPREAAKRCRSRSALASPRCRIGGRRRLADRRCRQGAAAGEAGGQGPDPERSRAQRWRRPEAPPGEHGPGGRERRAAG